MTKIVKFAILVVGMFLVLSACQAETNASITLGEDPKIFPPILNVIIGEETIGTTSGAYCWTEEVSRNHAVGECIDTEDPVVIEKAKEGEPPAFPAGSTVELEFSISDQSTSVLMTVQTRTDGTEQDVTLTDQTFHLPEEPDDYIYRVSADWEQGDTSHALIIRVE